MISAKGKQLDWHPALTVRDVLKAVSYDFATVLVRVNNRIVPREQWDTYQVPDNAKVDIHPMVAGG